MDRSINHILADLAKLYPEAKTIFAQVLLKHINCIEKLNQENIQLRELYNQNNNLCDKLFQEIQIIKEDIDLLRHDIENCIEKLNEPDNIKQN